MTVSFKFFFAFILLCSLSAQGQSGKWFAEAAIHATGDAELYFIAPSWSLGGGRYIGKQWSVSSNYNYFSRSIFKSSEPKQTYQSQTVSVLLNFNFLGVLKPERGMYLGVGGAWQNRKEKLVSNNQPIEERKEYFTGVYNLGYRFPVVIRERTRSLAVDLKATGGYKENSDTDAYQEILTQVMLGIRFRY